MSNSLCEFLAWDTEFFGHRIARAHGDTLTQERLKEIDAWCRENQIACLYFFATPDDALTAQLAESNNFLLTDNRLTFERSLDGFTSDPATFAQIEIAQPADLAQLRKLARVSHTGSRFYFDTHFARSRCDDLYDRWITNAVQDPLQIAFVARSGSRVVGYAACQVESSESRIGLIAVDESAARRGWGTRLIQRAFAWSLENDRAMMSIVTQGRNLAAQRLYQQNGFRTRSLYLTYHRWYVPTAG